MTITNPPAAEQDRPAIRVLISSERLNPNGVRRNSRNGRQKLLRNRETLNRRKGPAIPINQPRSGRPRFAGRYGVD